MIRAQLRPFQRLQVFKPRSQPVLARSRQSAVARAASEAPDIVLVRVSGPRAARDLSRRLGRTVAATRVIAIPSLPTTQRLGQGPWLDAMDAAAYSLALDSLYALGIHHACP